MFVCESVCVCLSVRGVCVCGCGVCESECGVCVCVCVHRAVLPCSMNLKEGMLRIISVTFCFYV